jgi:hypothetical protein
MEIPGLKPWVIAALLLAAAPAMAACDAPAFREFDFWIGDWRVQKPDGTFAGTNHIDQEYGGCVIHEHYVTGHGYSGESLNIYDASRKLWHQSWVDDSGTLLLLEGRLKGKSMVLEGASPGADGKPLQNRITWTPNADGSVRQLWETADGKGQWTTVFDGHYTKK